MNALPKTRTGLDEHACWMLISDLIEAGSDHEADVVQDLLVRTGWAWRCEAVENGSTIACGAVTDYDSEHCSDCGVHRLEYFTFLVGVGPSACEFKCRAETENDAIAQAADAYPDEASFVVVRS